MGLLARRPGLRWALPGVAAAGVVAVVVSTAGGSADAADHPVLPPVSAYRLLTDLQQPTTRSFEGTVSWDVDLGLPSLPDALPATGPGAGGPSGTGALLGGAHTLRVWADGPERARVAIVDGTRETDVVRDGRDVWTWTSADRTAAHTVLPDATGAPGLAAAAPTPDAVARAVLDAAGPTTAVTTDSTARVAGRPAYELVLDPRDAGTLVDRVVVAVDAATHVPLRVQVYSTRADDPAVDVGFTRVAFTTPAASRFAFAPPRGATVTQVPLPDLTALSALGGSPGTGQHATTHEPTVVGDGWDQVVVVRLTAAQRAALAGADAGTTAEPGAEVGGAEVGALLDRLPAVHGPWGSGHVLAGTLFSALLTDDGRVAVGAVPPDALTAALAHPAGGVTGPGGATRPADPPAQG